MIGRKGESALSGFGARPEGGIRNVRTWSLQVLFFCPFTPALNTDHGGHPGLAGELCSQNPGPPPPPAALASEPEITIVIVIIMMRASSVI